MLRKLFHLSAMYTITICTIMLCYSTFYIQILCWSRLLFFQHKQRSISRHHQEFDQSVLPDLWHCCWSTWCGFYYHFCFTTVQHKIKQNNKWLYDGQKVMVVVYRICPFACNKNQSWSSILWTWHSITGPLKCTSDLFCFLRNLTQSIWEVIWIYILRVVSWVELQDEKDNTLELFCCTPYQYWRVSSNYFQEK